MAAGRELFIYWKVAEVDAAAALASAAAWMEEARALQPALVVRLYQRAGGPPDHVTVMETYALPGVGLDESLATRLMAASASRLGERACAGRHVEVFEGVPL